MCYCETFCAVCIICCAHRHSVGDWATLTALLPSLLARRWSASSKICSRRSDFEKTSIHALLGKWLLRASRIFHWSIGFVPQSPARQLPCLWKGLDTSAVKFPTEICKRTTQLVACSRSFSVSDKHHKMLLAEQELAMGFATHLCGKCIQLKVSPVRSITKTTAEGRCWRQARVKSSILFLSSSFLLRSPGVSVTCRITEIWFFSGEVFMRKQRNLDILYCSMHVCYVDISACTHCEADKIFLPAE